MNDSIDKKILLDVYNASGDIQFEVIRRKLDNVYTVSVLEIETIEQTYKKALELCSACKCDQLLRLEELYSYDLLDIENKFEKIEEIKKQISSLGGCGELNSYIGLSVNYIPQGNVIGGELTILGAVPVFQKKQIKTENEKKFRACGYYYPTSLGLLSVGYERSFTYADYDGFKINPVWVNAFVSFHPVQFLYVRNKISSSIVWRPEIGICFSTLSVNYAYNLPLKKQFDPLPNHMISLKLVLPVLKPAAWN